MGCEHQPGTNLEAQSLGQLGSDVGVQTVTGLEVSPLTELIVEDSEVGLEGGIHTDDGDGYGRPGRVGEALNHDSRHGRYYVRCHVRLEQRLFRGHAGFGGQEVLDRPTSVKPGRLQRDVTDPESDAGVDPVLVTTVRQRAREDHEGETHHHGGRRKEAAPYLAAQVAESEAQ